MSSRCPPRAAVAQRARPFTRRHSPDIIVASPMTGQFEICDLRVAGAPSAPPVGGSGVHIIGGQDFSIRNVSFVDCYDAITLEGPGCTQATMENIKINSGPTTHGGISLTRCSVINWRGISMVTGNQTIP